MNRELKIIVKANIKVKGREEVFEESAGFTSKLAEESALFLLYKETKICRDGESYECTVSDGFDAVHHQA